MLPEQFGYLAIFVSFTGISFYIRDMLKGKTKPNLVSWFFWMLAPMIGTFLELKAGAGLSVLPVFSAGFVCVPVLLLAVIRKNAYWKISVFDISCGICSLSAIVFWIITKNTSLSLIFAMLAEVFAATPTLIKVWSFPETETITGYAPGVFNNILGLFLIKNWIFSIYSFGIFLIIENSLIMILIARKKIL